MLRRKPTADAADSGEKSQYKKALRPVPESLRYASVRAFPPEKALLVLGVFGGGGLLGALLAARLHGLLHLLLLLLDGVL